MGSSGFRNHKILKAELGIQERLSPRRMGPLPLSCVPICAFKEPTMNDTARDLSKYFRIGISPEYIEINPDLINLIPAVKPEEIWKIVDEMVSKNDRIFGQPAEDVS